MLSALGTLSVAQVHGIEATAKALCQLLDYCATHPDATIQYTTSNMIIYIHSSASYKSEFKSCSHMGGIFLSDQITNPTKPPTKQPTQNGAIQTASCILKWPCYQPLKMNFLVCFYNAHKGAALCHVLIKMNYPQPATPIQTDNSIATGITNGTVRQYKPKAIDMHFSWIQDWVVTTLDTIATEGVDLNVLKAALKDWSHFLYKHGKVSRWSTSFQ